MRVGDVGRVGCSRVQSHSTNQFQPNQFEAFDPPPNHKTNTQPEHHCHNQYNCHHQNIIVTIHAIATTITSCPKDGRRAHPHLRNDGMSRRRWQRKGNGDEDKQFLDHGVQLVCTAPSLTTTSPQPGSIPSLFSHPPGPPFLPSFPR